MRPGQLGQFRPGGDGHGVKARLSPAGLVQCDFGFVERSLRRAELTRPCAFHLLQPGVGLVFQAVRDLEHLADHRGLPAQPGCHCRTDRRDLRDHADDHVEVAVSDDVEHDADEHTNHGGQGSGEHASRQGRGPPTSSGPHCSQGRGLAGNLPDIAGFCDQVSEAAHPLEQPQLGEQRQQPLLYFPVVLDLVEDVARADPVSVGSRVLPDFHGVARPFDLLDLPLRRTNLPIRLGLRRLVVHGSFDGAHEKRLAAAPLAVQANCQRERQFPPRQHTGQRGGVGRDPEQVRAVRRLTTDVRHQQGGDVVDPGVVDHG
ncbi:MAG TPA: hypothetical protein VGD48_38945 [Kutzneria sp.]